MTLRLLVLGGTMFLSRAVAEAALVDGHEVTCAARGQSGPPPAEARFIELDRAAPDWSVLTGEWDAVVDVARTPSWVRDAVDALGGRIPHWTFVSSISVYADHATAGGGPDTLPTLDPVFDDVDLDSAQKYGAAKVACEHHVRAGAEQAFVVRPGLVVGPGDPTGRFSYWPDRLAGGGEVLAPESPNLPMQVIDARDLAAWIVAAAVQGRQGTYDASSRVRELGPALEEIAGAVGAPVSLTWADAEFLADQEVRHWAGPRSLPLWLPEDARGMVAHDVAPAFAAGLSTRPLAETARDTVEWMAAEQEPPRTGLTRAEEQDVLAAWHSLRA